MEGGPCQATGLYGVGDDWILQVLGRAGRWPHGHGGPHREEEGVTEQEGTDASFPMWQLEFTMLAIPGETRGLSSLQTPPLSRYQR